ncbi:type I polyketide synthase [Streptomonospora arabica]|uniref:Type I polyketide synthase n=1 Tax=Streptomonospora arabica TaxID=412417 RepID=A0ABV9SS33_9ACTN
MTRPVIVGMSCRLPGGVDSPESLWAALYDGADLITDPSDDHPHQREDVLPGGLLDDADMDLDADHFGLSPLETRTLDPQQALLLEGVDEALQDAGIAPGDLRRTPVGVWVGSSCLDQSITHLGTDHGGTMVETAGALPSMLAGRLARAFDLRGAAEVVNTACSASMVALHRARQALLLGEVDTAVVAGVQHLGLDTHTRMFRNSGTYSPTGRCRPFDVDADGFVRGEGVAVLVLTTAERASATGARVRAELLGSHTNADGFVPHGLASPSRGAQTDLLRHVYERSGVDPYAVGYVHAHGTATRAGDAAESMALANVMGRGRAEGERLVLGSVKANLGHLEGAAGVVSVVSTVLALEHGLIPPTPHHTEPLPRMAELGLEVATAPRPWPGPPDRRRLAGVSAFGFGGTNSHVILALPEAAHPETGAQEEPAEPVARLLPVSAAGPAPLAETADRWAGHLHGAPHAAWEAITRTAATGRDHLAQRAAVVAEDPTGAAAALEALAAGRGHPALIPPRRAPARPPRVVFVFPGHGSHRPGMGELLARREPVYAAALQEARAALDAHRPQTPLEEADLRAVQPAAVAHQIALSALLAHWGVRPDAVVGHSLGEAAAARAAGALSLEDTARLVAERSALLAESAALGGMLATDLDADRAVAAARASGTSLAAVNGPASTVLSGTHAALAALREHLEAHHPRARFWEVDQAPPAHSPLLDAAADRLAAALGELAPRESEVPMVSTATGAGIGGTELTGDYWGRQLRAPVQLAAAVAAAVGDPGAPAVLVEVSARSVLAPALTDDVLACAEEAHDEHTALLRLAGGLYSRGVPRAWDEARPAAAVPLPARAWARPSDRPEAPERGDDLARRRAELEAAADEAQRRDVLARALQAWVAEQVPGQAGAEPVGLDTDLAALGLGSLVLMGLRTRLHQLTGRQVEIADFYGEAGVATLGAVLAPRSR